MGELVVGGFSWLEIILKSLTQIHGGFLPNVWIQRKSINIYWGGLAWSFLFAFRSGIIMVFLWVVRYLMTNRKFLYIRYKIFQRKANYICLTFYTLLCVSYSMYATKIYRVKYLVVSAYKSLRFQFIQIPSCFISSRKW